MKIRAGIRIRPGFRIRPGALLVVAALLGALMLAVLGSWGWLPRAVGGVLVLGLFAAKVREFIQLASRDALADLHLQSRESIALLLGSGAWWYAWRHDSWPWVVAAVVVMGAGLWFGRGVPAEVAAPLVRNLPGAPERRVDPPKLGAFWWALLLLATLIVADVVVPFLPAWTVLVVVVVGVAAMLRVGIPILRFRLNRVHIVRAIQRFQPEFVMMYAAFNGARYQLGMWEPYLKASGRRFAIITRNPSTMKAIAQVTDAPVISPVEWARREIKDCMPTSVRAAFYVQNSRYNDVSMPIKRVTHVWLNHGDSDKPANFNRRHARYDRLVVCGQAGIDRYAAHGIEVDPERFVVVGRPQVADITLSTASIADVSEPLVLYAPTWRGLRDEVNFSSLPLGPVIVRSLLDRGARVLFRPHPLSYKHKERVHIKKIHRMLEKDGQQTGREHIWGEQADTAWSVADCTNASDALVSDVSSVVSDYLASGKPYAMVSTRTDAECFRREYPIARSGYVLLPESASIKRGLDEMLGDDPLAEDRRERRIYYLGGFSPQEAAQEVSALVEELIDPQPHRVPTTSLGA